jgi:hypothetical protein
MTPATRAAALILAITDTAPVYPVAVFRRYSQGDHPDLYDGLQIVAVCGPRDPGPRDRVRVVRADLRGCRGLGEAMGRVEAAVRVVDLFGVPA